MCRWIVAGKLHNQEKLLRYFAKSRDAARKDALEKGAAALRRLRRSVLAAEGGTPDQVRDDITFHLVEDVREVLAIALEPRAEREAA